MAYRYPFTNVEEKGKKLVWEKGKIIVQKGITFDSDVWRYDICGNVMKYSEHGNVDSEHGWEIDHINPSALDGSDDLSNLQPLQWEANRTKGDKYPWNCK